MMKKIGLLTVILGVCAAYFYMAARQSTPLTVQGIPYQETLGDRPMKIASSDWNEPGDELATPDGQFTFDMIKNWSGEGENRAAFVVQFNDGTETSALVFGYRWDGDAYGVDMVKAIIENNPRLYGLIQYTSLGYTICGIGWDTDNDGDIRLTDGTTTYESENGLFIHPSKAYDYDNWKSLDSDDRWGAGWYQSYWSYWIKSSQEASFGYSGLGASSRKLTDGCWDGWNFARGMSSRSWLPFTAAPALIPDGAKTEFCVDGIYYSLIDYSKKTVQVTAPATGSYSGAISIPARFTDEEIEYNVVEIADTAFRDSKVISVSLPETITKIGKSAFANSSVATINIPESVKSIGAYAFSGCVNVTSAFYPSLVTKLPEGIYAGTGITEAVIPGHITEIGANAFDGCGSLSKIEIPAGVKTIGEQAFAACDALTSVKHLATAPISITENTFSDLAYQNARLMVPEGFTSVFASAEGWRNFSDVTEMTIPVYVGDRFIKDQVPFVITANEEGNRKAMVTYHQVASVTSANVTNANKAGFVGDIVVPQTINYQGVDFTVDEINDSTFYGASAMTSVVLPENVSRFGAYVFYNCKAMTSVTLPENLVSIPKYTFYTCEKLTEVSIPSTVTEIATYGFSYCSLIESITLPESVRTLGDRAFFQCKALKSVNIPVSVTAIPNNCFSYCTSLESMDFGDQITEFGSTVFQNCTSLKSVKWPSQVHEIPDATFSGCTALETFEIPSHVTEIGSTAFKGCSGLTMNIPDNVTTIGSGAFQNCTAFKSMALPESITTIPNNVFYGCSNLTEVTVSGSVEKIGNGSFRDCKSLGSIRFGGVETLSETGDGKVVLPESLTYIDQYAFYNCAALDVVLPAHLTYIGQYAFYGMTKLTDIDLREGLTTIGGSAFRNISGLTRIVIPSTVKSLGSDFINGCPNVRLYVCNPAGFNALSYTFRTASGKYAPIVVPVGQSETYKAKSYWKNSVITEPTFSGMTIGTPSVTCTDKTAMIKLPLTVTYAEDDLPDLFINANCKAILDEATNLLVYSVENGQKQSIEVSPDENGSLVADLAGLKAGTQYGYRWLVTYGDNTYPSETGTFTTYNNPIVDFSRIDTWVGEGDARMAVIVTWNDGTGIDNLVIGVRFDEANPFDFKQVVEAANDACPRLRYGVDGFEFDLNGDGLFDGSDHLGGSESKAWKMYFAASVEENLSDNLSNKMIDGSILLMDYLPTEDNEPSLDYLFYLPAQDKTGIWLPDEYELILSDQTQYLPFYINAGEGSFGDYYQFSITDDNGETVSSPIADLSVETGNTMATVKFAGSAGNANVRVRGYVDWNATEYSNVCAVKVLAPERPVASLAFDRDDVTMSVNNCTPPSLIITPEDATYTAVTYTSSNPDIAVDAATGAITINSMGDAVITATSLYDNEVSASYNLHAVLDKPIDNIILGDGSGTVYMHPVDIFAIDPKIEPADADIPRFSWELSADEGVFKTYNVGSFVELIATGLGEGDLTLSALDGSGMTATYHIVVSDRDRTPAADAYEDGTFWLNEEWFGHFSGSLNYFTKNHYVIYRAYEAQNPGGTFGCTSPYGMIYGGRLFVTSKQAKDGGDYRDGGGRLVIADASTLKRIASFDEIGGDGRALVGVNPDKVYVGNTSGIKVVNIDNESNSITLGADVEGISAGSAYSGQIGDMLKAGKYVFAIQQNVGMHVIDPVTDVVIMTIDDDTDVHGITQSADGNVWLGCGNMIYCFDPVTLERLQAIEIPGSIRCDWGSWRSANFFASENDNTLFWASGKNIYRWEIGSDIPTDPFFTLGEIDDMAVSFYSTMAYDSRHDEILFAAIPGYGAAARNNWYNILDGKTGELKQSVRLKDYYWFPAMPFFPDKYAPEISIENISAKADDKSAVIDLDEYVTDPDNLDYNISYSISVDEGSGLAEFAVEGHELTITPVESGDAVITLSAESNGRVTAKTIPVRLTKSNDGTVGVDDVSVLAGSITVIDGQLSIEGYEGYDFTVFDINGRAVESFASGSRSFTKSVDLPSGIYIVHGENSSDVITKKIVII